MSNTQNVIIRPVTESDYAAWHALWLAYIKYYEETVSEEITKATWRRIMDDAVPINGDVAELDGVIIGFSNSVLHEATWTDKPVCYLEDLYVDETIRGKGAGRALIDNLVQRSKDNGWSRLYWHTNTDNERARKLYDSYKPAEDQVKYRLFFND